MSSLDEIERAIDGLSAQELAELYAWLDERHPLPVDDQLKAEVDAGRFDDRIARAMADHRGGRTKPL